MNIIVCTQGSVGISVIRKLFELRYRPSNITVITYDIKSLHNKPLIDLLEYFNIQWFVVENNMELLDDIIVTRNANILLNIAYKYIFKNPVLTLPNIKLINLHPGILPYYRGWLSTPWSIINGETHVGYTYHLISSGIDKGDIILIDRFPILSDSTAFDLHFKIFNSAINKLDYIVSGKWSAIPQIGDGAYYKNIFPSIDPAWDNDKIERFKRATYFPPYYE